MSKRDDDSQADMEVGMTTAERRRRRRRGGLRVPSDNVPRRQSTPPVVAPVPEDPALSISLAFSFAAESSEPMPHAPRESAPSFANHESVPTVIDPVSDPAIDPGLDSGMASVIDSVSGPIEQADFEMKTREMSAVDLEELGLDELGALGATLPFQRVSIAAIESRTTTRPDLEMPFQRQSTDVADDVEVDLDPSLDGAMTLDQDLLSGERRPETLSGEIELDGGEPTTIHPGPPVPPMPPSELAARAQDSPHPRPVAAATESSQPHPRPPMGGDSSQPRTMSGELRSGPTGPVGPAAPAASPPSGGGYRLSRAQTVALSEDDLEEVREQARISGQHQPAAPVHPPSIIPPPPPMPSPARSISTSIPPPMPPMRMTKPRLAVPALPELDPLHHEDSVVVDAPTEFEVDVDGFVDSRPVAVPPAEAAHPEARPVAPPPSAAPAPPAVSSLGALGALGTLGPLSSLSAVTSLGALSASPPPAAAPAIAPAAAPSPAASLVPHMPSPSMAPQQSQASQAIAPVAPPGAPAPLPPRDSQPMAALRDGHGAPPPPPPVVHKAPPAPPPAPPAPPPAAKKAAVVPLAKSELSSGRDNRDARAEAKQPRGKPWFVELFDEDYLRTLPFLTPQATQAEAEFVIDALGLTPGAQVLDVGCGYGRHAMELAARGFHIVGLDLSTPLLVRGGEEAHRRGLTINFVRGDMRELDFESQFDGAYCLFSTFGYFDDETNKKTVANMARALRPGGRLLIEILNRDYVIADLPTRVWWEGDGCVVLEEVELNYFSSRIQVNRSVVFDDGRQLEQEISVRAYSLHEVGKLMHSAGLRVLEVSGAYHTRTRFFGNQSRHIIVLAERKDPGVA